MNIYWTMHAKERFDERALIYGVSRTEIEEIVKKQEVKVSKGFDEKYKKEKFEAIGIAWNKLFTVQKAEDFEEIIIITLWESTQEEEKLWLSKKK